MVLQHKGLLALMKGALRLIYPSQCLGCAQLVASDGGLCAACWSKTEFISDRACRLCAVPLPGQIASDASPCGTPKDGDGGTDPEGLLCDDCVAMSRGWDRACATMVYAGTGRRLVLMLKHGDRLDLLPALGAWLARSAQPLIQPDTVIVPIPMHLTRQMKRKYNQAALLGRCVARAHGRDWHPDLLYRTRQGAMQGKASLIQRFRNQDGAIAARADRVAALEGRPVLLVDDVMASGATMMAAATALRSAGVGQISVLALARAVKPA